MSTPPTPSRRRERISSRQQLKVLHSFLVHQGDSHHGYEIMKETGIGPGTLYGILKRLHDRGYLDKVTELVGGRCRIRYHLTERGRRYAKRALIEDEYERGATNDLTLEL